MFDTTIYMIMRCICHVPSVVILKLYHNYSQSREIVKIHNKEITMNQSNCIVAQSGGPTVAINASLAGVIAGVKSSEKYDICYGAVNVILGILNENYLNLSDIFADDANLEKLKTTPAMYLGSCRHKLPDYKDDDSPYVYIFHQFDNLSVKAFFYIGGNDSMDTVLKL